MQSGLAQELEVELRELSACPGVTGAEGPVADWITARLTDLPVPARRDALGNVVVAEPDQAAPRVLVTAHMDQVGYMVSRVERTRALCLPLGSPQAPEDEAVVVSVTGFDHPPLHGVLERAAGESTGIVRADRIDEIQVGDRVQFARPFTSSGDGWVRGPALDDRVGCLLVLHAARALCDEFGDVAFAWTVREETDQAGVVRVARALEPEVLVAVDITPATDLSGGSESVVSVGGGPVITLLDGGMVADRFLVESFDRAARRVGIGWQREVVQSGSSEAGRIQRSLGIPALPLLVPIEAAHSEHEAGHTSDMIAALELLVAGVQEVVGGRSELVGTG